MGKRVHGDPVGRLASRPPQELPGPLRIGRQEPLEEAKSEPAQLELALREQAIGQLEVAGRALAPRRLAKAPVDGGAQRPAHPVRRTEARSNPVLPFEVFRISQLGEAGRQGPTERVRIRGVLGQACPEPFGLGLVGRDKGDGPGGDRRVGRRSGRHLPLTC